LVIANEIQADRLTRPKAEGVERGRKRWEIFNALLKCNFCYFLDP